MARKANSDFVTRVPDKGPPPHVDDSDREAFLSHLTGGITAPLPVYSFHRTLRRSDIWLSHFQDDLLSCDVDWWIKRFISHCNSRPTLSREGVPGGSWSLASDIISGFFWDVHALCSWYRCRPLCKLWRRITSGVKIRINTPYMPHKRARNIQPHTTPDIQQRCPHSWALSSPDRALQKLPPSKEPSRDGAVIPPYHEAEASTSTLGFCQRYMAAKWFR
ncbi:hypothetical protein NMY22_g6073 [Coprinellus aureogranulatus]|nr:hypothetical protein NMY22_g6073 [Coprinellus aureogranulatus]